MPCRTLRIAVCLLTLTALSFAAEKNLKVSDLPQAAQRTIANAVAPWVQKGALTPSNASDSDMYGMGLGYDSVAIEGNTIAVGMPFYSGNAAPYPGAIFVFEKTGSDWSSMTQTALLTASNATTEAALGSSVSISGNTIVSGGSADGSPYIPAVYVFVEPAGGWTNMTETAQLTSTDGNINPHDVAISGNTIVATGKSGAYVFVEPAGGWSAMTQTAELTASTSANLQNVGTLVVAIDGSTIALCGQKIATAGNRSYSLGAVAVYQKPSGGWTNMTQTAVLTPTDVRSTLYPVAIEGGTIVAGDAGGIEDGQNAAGNVNIFIKPSTGWRNASQNAMLTAFDAASGAELGTSVAISGSTIIAGAPGAEIAGHKYAGAVYVYNEPATGWTNMTQNSKLYFPDGYSASLGMSVAIDGTTLAASAPYFDTDGQEFVGEALVFEQQ